MNFTRASLLFLLASSSLSHLAAKEYSVNTNLEKVSCSLNTLTQEKMASLIGKFAAFEVPTGTAQTTYATGGFFSQTQGVANTTSYAVVDPFHDAVKNYMAVEVVIKNNSSKTLLLSKGEYLEGIEKAFVSKDEMIKVLYPQLNDKLRKELWAHAIAAGLFTVPAAGLLGIAIATILSPYDAPEALISLGLGACFFGIPAICFLAVAINRANLLDLSHEKEQNIQNNSFFKKLKNQFFQIYSPEESEYRIPAKSEFHDLFFIDLEKVERDYFSTIQPTLAIETEKE